MIERMFSKTSLNRSASNLVLLNLMKNGHDWTLTPTVHVYHLHTNRISVYLHRDEIGSEVACLVTKQG